MAIGKKYTYQEVKKIVEDKGCKLISDSYINAKTKLHIRCRCNNILNVKFSQFCTGSFCRNCMKEKFKLKYDFVKSFFENENCVLVTKDYINAKTPLEYICSCGFKSIIIFDSFKRGNRCKNCGNKKNKIKQTFTQEEAAKYFFDSGCVLLGEYNKAKIPVEFKCRCGRVGYKSLNNFQKSKCCKFCGLEKRKGSNHYEWISDREAKHQYDKFKEKCYKMLQITLRKIGAKKTSKTNEMLGFTPEELQRHICSDNNWSFLKNKKWHLDHIFPISAFIKNKIFDVKTINCLENLKPMFYKDNLSKSDHYDPEKFRIWLEGKGIYLNNRKEV